MIRTKTDFPEEYFSKRNPYLSPRRLLKLWRRMSEDDQIILMRVLVCFSAKSQDEYDWEIELEKQRRKLIKEFRLIEN